MLNPATSKRGQRAGPRQDQRRIAAMVTVFSSSSSTIDELGAWMPDLRARETGLKDEIAALDAQAADRDAYLKLADDLEGFLESSARTRPPPPPRTASASCAPRPGHPHRTRELTHRHRPHPGRGHPAAAGHYDTTDTEGDMRKVRSSACGASPSRTLAARRQG